MQPTTPSQPSEEKVILATFFDEDENDNNKKQPYCFANTIK
jgi:hypothetical protein